MITASLVTLALLVAAAGAATAYYLWWQRPEVIAPLRYQGRHRPSLGPPPRDQPERTVEELLARTDTRHPYAAWRNHTPQEVP